MCCGAVGRRFMLHNYVTLCLPFRKRMAVITMRGNCPLKVGLLVFKIAIGFARRLTFSRSYLILAVLFKCLAQHQSLVRLTNLRVE